MGCVSDQVNGRKGILKYTAFISY